MQNNENKNNFKFDKNNIKQVDIKYHQLFKHNIAAFALHEMIYNEKGIPVDYRFIDVNPAFERMTGLKFENIINKTVLEVLPKTEKYWIDTYGKVVLTGEPVFFENYSKEIEKYFQVTAFRPQNNQFACFFTDISNQKKAYNKLKKKETEYEATLNGLLTGVVVHNAKTKIIFSNPAAEKILGLTFREMKGKEVNDKTWYFVDENKIKLKIEDYPVSKVISSKKELKNYLIGINRNDREYITWANVNAVPLFDSNNILEKVLVNFVEITEEIEATKKIKKLLNEKEILLQETHHRIKNNMSVLRGIFSMESYSINNKEAKKVLDNASNRIMSMLVLYDYLYRNEITHNMSLKYYLSQLIDQIIRVHKNIISLKTNILLDDFKIHYKKISSIGIIINELFTNSIKYAFKNKKSGIITIKIEKINKTLTIVYSDDGIGLPYNFDIEKCNSFGMKLINMLIKDMNGSITASSENGSKFIIT